MKVLGVTSILFLAIFSIVFQSCLTCSRAVFSTSGRYVVHVNSYPPGADVYLNSVVFGITPINIKMKFSSHKDYITVKDQNENSKTFTLKTKMRSGYFFNILCFGTPLIGFPVDYLTGAYKTPSQTYYEVNFTDDKPNYDFKTNFYLITKTDTFFIKDYIAQKGWNGKKLCFTTTKGEDKQVATKEMLQFKTRNFEGYTIKTKDATIWNSVFEQRPYQPYFKKKQTAIMNLLIKKDEYSLLQGFHMKQSDLSAEYKDREYFYLFKENEFVIKVTKENMIAVFGQYFNTSDEFIEALNNASIPKKTIIDIVKLYYKTPLPTN